LSQKPCAAVKILALSPGESHERALGVAQKAYRANLKAKQPQKSKLITRFLSLLKDFLQKCEAFEPQDAITLHSFLGKRLKAYLT